MALQLGVSTTNTANKWLNVFGPSGTTFTALTDTYVQLHTAIPGASGTNAASAETTRKAVTWAAAAANGVRSSTGTLSWTSWAAGTETITHISLWDAATSGNFLWSGALSASKIVGNGDTLNITALSIGIAATSLATT